MITRWGLTTKAAHTKLMYMIEPNHFARALSQFNAQILPADTRGCQIWRGPITDRGYGRFYFNYKHHRAHRAAWFFAHGDPGPTLEVCHTCDIPLCVNPQHLFLGTHEVNMADMHKKRRGASLTGMLNGNHKLKDVEVLALRNDHRTGQLSQRALATKYSISQGQVWQIIHNRQRREGGVAEVAATREDIIRYGLGDDERERLVITLED